jgi:MSHA biogenesis protein MshP
MCPELRPQRGFGAPLAIFVIVAGAALAGAIMTLSGTQQTGVALDILGARAYQTARAGLEWGVHHVLRAGGTDCTGIESGGAGTSFSPGGALAEFRVTVRCTESVHTEANVIVNMYALSATACNLPAGSCPAATPPAPTYVERQLRVTVGSN